jgi:DNA-binding transcriptional LysR family regulator
LLVRQLCLAAGFEPMVAQEAREPMAQIGFVAAGLGIAILPAPFECVALPGVRYVALSDPGAYLSLGVAVRRDHQSACFMPSASARPANISAPSTGRISRAA